MLTVRLPNKLETEIDKLAAVVEFGTYERPND